MARQSFPAQTRGAGDLASAARCCPCNLALGNPGSAHALEGCTWEIPRRPHTKAPSSGAEMKPRGSHDGAAEPVVRRRGPGPARSGHTHPASHQELVPELDGGVVEGELLAAQVVYGRVALQVQEQVIGEANLPRLLLKQRTRGSPFQGAGRRLPGQPRDRGRRPAAALILLCLSSTSLPLRPYLLLSPCASFSSI